VPRAAENVRCGLKAEIDGLNARHTYILYIDSIRWLSLGLQMAAISQLKQIAIGVANHLQMRALDNADKAEGEAQTEKAKLAYNRAIGFQAKVHGNFQCPRCWVANEKQTVLTPIGGGANKDNFFQCDICELKVSLLA
jgi:hypothetical protein